MKIEERRDVAKKILLDIYRTGYLETLFNAQKEKHQKEGWTLKNGSWSPWFFNLRPVGASPEIVVDIVSAMNHMIRDEVEGVDQIVGIEMAGVPLVSAVSTASGPGCKLIPYAYTRPFPGAKLRTPEEAKKAIAKHKVDFGYGEKELVEGRFEDGNIICITDDMVTNFGSKLIAKYIIEFELEKRGVKDYKMDHVAVVLDREQGAAAQAQEHGMYLHALINFKTDGLGWLKDVMRPEEHALLMDFQTDPDKYQNKGLQEKVIAEANALRGE